MPTAGPPAGPKGLVTIADVQRLARRRLPRLIYDFVEGGSEDEVTLRRNRSAFEHVTFRPRMLTGVADRDLSTTVLGTRLSLPVMFAPAGLQGLVHRRGELAAASAASDAGTVYVLSIGSSYSIEEVRAEANGPLWLQLSPWKDRSLVETMMRRARDAGYSTLCLTLDVPVPAKRERDIRNGMTLPLKVSARNLFDVASRPSWWSNLPFNLRERHGNYALPGGGHGAISVAKWVTNMLNPAATWDELRWMKRQWEGPVVVKGVLTPDDARRARDAGADGIIVSNHGGRQLDGARATIDALPEIADVVGTELDVMVDSGFRRGSDVVKAMALGAKACLVGRPYVLSLAWGDAGPRRVLEIFRDEIDTTMALLGVSSWKDINRSLIDRG